VEVPLVELAAPLEDEEVPPTELVPTLLDAVLLAPEPPLEDPCPHWQVS
jgi:hypothetical protein